MGIDVMFWRGSPAPDEPQEPAVVYGALGAGAMVNGLDDLPTNDIVAALAAAFPGLVARPPDGADVPLSEGLVEVWWGRRFVRFDLAGDYEEALVRIWEVMRSFGCSVYDPLTDTLHPVDAPPDWARSDAEASFDWRAEARRLEALRNEYAREREEREAKWQREAPEQYAQLKREQEELQRRYRERRD